ncbi:phosphodiester glycosidase family protein [Eubacterium sp. F2]|uniref:phosphodiester glycosidase family protein n=1 Tax=Eubacterium sp. F2 TaxID=3381348 RepID=UPI0039081A24
MKRLSVIILAVVMTVTMIPFFGFADDSASSNAQDVNVLKTLDETDYPIVKGVKETTVNLKNSSDESVVSHVLTVDPGSNTSFKASCGGYYTEGSTAETRKAKAAKWSSSDWKFMTTTDQAADYEKATSQRVLAATNADYFNMSTSQPLGSIIMEGNKNLNAGSTEPYFAVLKDGSKVIRDASVPTDDVEEGVSGPCYLVKDGSVCTDVPMDVIPRNSIGIKADGSVVIVEMDGRIEKSVGVTALQLGNYLKSIGCVNALLLDGGGSATLATRREGSSSLSIANTPSDGTERVIGSALLLVDNGSVSSTFDHASITPKNEYYTPGSKVNFQASGVSTSGDKTDIPSGAEWSLAEDSKDCGSIDSATGVYTDNGKNPERHTVNVELKYNGNVLGTGKIIISAPDKIKFVNDSLNLDYGEKSDLNLRVYANGRLLNIKDGDLDWKIEDSSVGSISGNTFTAAKNNEKGNLSVKSKITAVSKWDTSVSADITVGIGTAPQIILDGGDSDGLSYENIPYTHHTSTAPYYAEETNAGSKSDLIVIHYMSGDVSRGGIASAQQVDVDHGEVRFGQKALKLNYDFTNINGTEGACIGLKHSVEVTGSPTSVGVWVYAPEGTPNLWLRLQCVDGNGIRQNLNFTDETKNAKDGTKGGINWVGWKYLTCSLKDSNGNPIPGPITIPEGEFLRVMDTNGSPQDPNRNGVWNCTKDSSGNVSEAKYIGHSKGSLYFDNLQFVYGNNPEDTDNPQIATMSVGEQLSGRKSLLKNNNVTVDSNTVYFGSTFSDVKNSHTSGIDWAKVYIDGTDVTDRQNTKFLQNDGELFVNGIKLPNGVHSITMRVRDKNGNESKITKQFTVKGDNAGLTSVAVKPEQDHAVLGRSVKLNVTSGELKNLKSMSMDLNLGTNCTVSNVEFKNGFSGTKEYDQSSGTLKLTANAPDSLPDSASDAIAEITVDVPQKQSSPAYLTYSVSSGKTESRTTASEDVLNTFGTGTESLPIRAAYTIDTGTVMDGQPAVITVKDASGKPAEGVSVMQYSSSGDINLGKTGADGTLTTSALSSAGKEFTIYASGDDGMSFSETSKCVSATGSEDGKPYHIEAGVCDDPETMKNLVWMSNPSKAKKNAVVQYAPESEYTKDGEKAFQSKEGKCTLLSYLVSGNANYSNSVMLSGLKPGTKYVYRVGDGSIWSDAGTFTTKSTAQEDGKETTRFFVIGDTQTSGNDMENLNKILGKVSTGYDFGIQLGDFVDGPSIYSYWDNILTPFDQLNGTDTLHVTGNHEEDGDPQASHVNTIFNTKNRDYYSVTYGNVYVATIAFSSDADKMQEAADWLVKDASASSAQWKILAMHQPAYYTNTSGGNEIINKIIPPACDKAGIDFVFAGHDHSYARTYPLYNREEPESVQEEKLNQGEAYSGKGTVYYICASTGEKSYAVSNNPDFHFAKADLNFDHGIYLSVSADNDQMKVTTYDGDKVYDTFTKESSCIKDGHTYSLYSNGKAICSRCHRAYPVTEIGKTGYTGWLKDKESGKNMYFIDGKYQTGVEKIGSQLYLFDEHGLGITRTLDIAGTQYKFENGKYVSSSDSDAGTVDFGFCGADSSTKGQNLIFAYQEGNKVLNVGLNPLISNPSGKMEDWKQPILVPWQEHRNEIVKANVGNGVTNLGQFFIYNAPDSAVESLKNAKAALKEVHLPDSLTEIGNYALMDKENLKSVTIPENVKSVGKMAFAFSDGIQVTCKNADAMTFGDNVFYSCGSSSILSLPDTNSWKEALKAGKISFPGTIRIGDRNYSAGSGGGGASGGGAGDTAELQKTLSSELTSARSIDISGYTDDSVQALKDAISAADKILQKDNPSKEELSSAEDALKAAVAGLKQKQQSAGAEVKAVKTKTSVQNQYRKGAQIQQIQIAGTPEKKSVAITVNPKQFPEKSDVYVYRIGKNGKLTALDQSPYPVKDGRIQITVNNGSYAMSSVPCASDLRAVKITKIKTKKGKVYLKWTSASGADGYRIYRKGTHGKYQRIKILNAKKLSWTSLRMNRKTYTFRIRAYVRVNGHTYYGQYSKAKKIKVK